MAHLIDETTGRAAMAYVGETPWHGLGEQLAAGADISEWVRAAGLEWDAQRAVVRYATALDQDSAEWKTADDNVVIFRSDTKAPLGIVGSGYQVVQPRAVVEFFRDLTEAAGFTMETAGSLKGGRVVWALARTNMEVRICGNDLVKGFLLVSTSLDGSLATTARFTSVRVVCNNTMTLAHKQDKTGVRVSHKSVFHPGSVKRELGLETFSQFADDAEALAARPVRDSEAEAFFIKVYHGMSSAEYLAAGEKDAKSVNKTLARVTELYKSGPGATLASANGTAWGLVNAVTRDADFSKPAHNPENRFTSSQFGPNADLKARAWDEAKALLA